MINFIVGLFYNHRWFRLAIKQLVFYFLIMYLFGLVLNLYLTKAIDMNFFNWSKAFYQNSTAIILILMGITLLFMLISIYFYNQLNETKRIQIKLEDIAHIWTNKIEQEKHVKIIKEYTHSTFLVRNIVDKEYKSKRIQRFNSENIVNNIKYFRDDELYLIVELLQMLDENLKVSSVPTYVKDKENIYIDEQNYFKEHNLGKTNVEILSKVSLCDHTINVTEIAINEFGAMDKNEIYSINSLHLATIVIAALSHDIGKIRNTKLLKSVGLDEVIVAEMDHPELSIEYFNNLVKNLGSFPENELIIKAIIEHHKSIVPNEKLSKLIFNSDKDARRKEEAEIIFKIKEKADETIKEFEKNKKDEINNEQIRMMQKQIDEKNNLIEQLQEKEVKPIEAIQEKEVKPIEAIEAIQAIQEKEVKEKEYKRALDIKKSVVRNREKDKEDELEEIAKIIKNSLNVYTMKGKKDIISKKDLLKNAKDSLKSITDDKFIYLTYYGLREIFEEVENKSIGFEDMKDHRFVKILIDEGIIDCVDSSRYYSKYEIFCMEKEKELSATVSLLKIPIVKLALTTEDVNTIKGKSRMDIFNIREIK